uniref:EF-hand domain-containing protein n=1 Tax=Amazona collaria TaxID=241587 RepID=A0A8B9GHF7_9PSIT
MEAVAARLRDFSRKQDGAVIQNMVLSARERLGKVLQRLAERGTVLEEARKRSKQFSESRQLLLDWMEEAEQSLEVPSDTTTSQEELKSQLAEHKAFQKVLRSKRPVLEATLRSGRALREGARLDQDRQPLEELLRDLKERWDALCSHAAERQHRLEEKLLLSGKFSEALQALLDWLYRAEPQLSEDAPVGGDRDLVSDLMDKHKVFQKELGKRAGCVRALTRLVRDPARGDSPWLQRQLEELSTRWDLVCRLSLGRQARLEAALRQAEEFHSLVQSFLRRLGESEQSLKYGAIPEEEALLQSLQCQQLELECITSLGEEILSSCHPDSVVTIKSWVTVAKSRFQEVQRWAQQQGERLQAQASRLEAEREDAAQLLEWMAVAEEALGLRDTEPLPQEAELLQELSAQHAVFMEELNRKQPDVEKVTKSCKQKLAAELGRRSAGKAPAELPRAPEPQSPLTAQVLQRWQQLWLLALDRQYRLETALQRLRELEEFAHFDFGVWRKRYMHWIGQMKSRVLDVFRGIDRDQDGRISQREFIESVLSSSECPGILQDPLRHPGSGGAVLGEMGMDGVCLRDAAQAGVEGLEPEEQHLGCWEKRSSP